MAKKTVVDPFGVPHVVATPTPKPKPAPTPKPSPVATATVAQPAAAAPAAAPVAQAMTQNPFETDPGYLAALAAEQAGSQQLDAALKAAQEQAIVQFGDPGLAGLAGFNLDPVTAAAAQANTQAGNSTLGQLGKQRDQNQQSLQNQLAAHGMIFSGDLGYKTGQNQQAYGSELFNQQQGVLQSLAGLSRDTIAQKQGLHSNTVGALTGAYNNAISNPGFWGAVNDGGASGAANAAATAGTLDPFGVPHTNSAPAPVTSSLAKPKSKLAVPPPPNPFAARTAKQTTGWRG